MPNNNPTGHNQYSKRKEQFENSGAPQTGDMPSDEMTEPGSDIRATSDARASAMDANPTTAVPAKRGFAAMDEATQRGIASKGGQSQGKDNNPGNFANDRDRAREAGRKGGEAHGSHR